MNGISHELGVVLDQQYIVNAEFQVVYDHAGSTRAVIGGFVTPYVRRASP